MPFNVRDANLIITRALPNGAATVNSNGIDLGSKTAWGDRLAQCELLLSAPALTTTQQPDAKTLTYTIQHDDASDFGSAATLAGSVIVQTGAGGAGAAAATFRMKIPTNCKRYVRVAIVGSATGDSSGASATLELLF